MNLKLKKTLKYLFIGIVSLLLLIFLIIEIALNFVLTSEKITPKIVHAVNQNLNAEFKAGRIELSFFSSFPNFSLEVENGFIVKQLLDSTQQVAPTKRDTLIAFNLAKVTVNPTAFLIHKKIDIKHIIFKNPQIYAYVDKNGKTNWDIVKESVDKDTISSTKDSDTYKANIDLDDVTITQGFLFYDDQNTALSASLKGLDLQLKAKYNQKNILLDLIMGTESLNFWKKGSSVIEDLSIGLSGKIDANRKTKAIDITDTKVRISDMEFIANGQLHRDMEKKEINMQLDLALKAPSLSSFIDLIPENILPKNRKYKSEGKVFFDAKVNGIYGNKKIPLVQANLKVEDGKIAYNGMPNMIDLIETDLSLLIDSSKKTLSFIDIKKFNIKGDGVNLRIVGKVDDVLENTKVSAKAVGSIDLSALDKIFPFKKDIELKGVLETDIDGIFFPKDIKNKDYGKINALGKISLHDVQMNYKKDSLVFASKNSKAVFIKENESTKFTKEKSNVIGGRIDLNGIQLSIKNKLNATADKIFFEFGISDKKDTTKITSVKSTINIENFHFNLQDTLKGVIKSAKGNFVHKPSAKNKKVPTIHTEFFIDSIGVKANNRFFAITNGNYNLDLTKKAKKRWPVTGQINFNHLYAFTPTFPLLLKMPQTKITLKPGFISLNRAKLELGKSDLLVSGKIYDLYKTIFDKKTLKAELTVNSKLIDANELIATLNKGAKVKDKDVEILVEESHVINDKKNTEPKPFVIPKRIDFRFNSSIAKVIYKDFSLRNVRGLITIKDQTLNLVNLQMMAKSAKMTTKVKLIAKESILPSTAFDFKLADIDLGNLLNLMPMLDSLLPMSQSFEGDVNFRIRGTSKLNEKNGVIAKTVDAIARLEGDNLIIMDSEVFTSLSKKLMFKNKDKNLIDHISVEILVHNKIIEILPALVIIDRYKFAIGGKHKLDMTYDYQFSILKSPLPFKAGVDIIGDADDYKIKLTKAKYKYIFSNKKRHQKKVDSTLIRKKLKIISDLPF
ncbi:MAG: hypothetical protein GQ552_08595 [Flavobacteriaceae bacterium]|nr:hypothetical protein [Flavobacteriaceae bacterium]